MAKGVDMGEQDAIFQRVSIRKYTDEPVSDADLERLLRAGMAAPSATNQQPWEFVVVKNKDVLTRLSESTPYTSFTKNAALAIVPCIRKSALRAVEMVDQDMGACVENILLEATQLGLGTCWQGIYPVDDRVETVRAIIDAPEGIDPFCIISVGHPAELPEPTGSGRYDPSRVRVIE